ncbi:MAG: pectate lyase [Proteobacteria bacterium]|nr:pectate lyase [Pseudomonadota bacterium]
MRKHLLKSIFFVGIFLSLKTRAACDTDKLEADVKAGTATCASYEVDRTIIIKNTVKFDGKGARITGVGSFDQCDQFPTNKAVFFIYSNGSILSNFTIVQSPEGIHVAEGFKNQIVNVRFQKVCEDAITNGNNKNNKSAKHTIIKNCSFENAEDKAIQSNGGSMHIIGNKFIDVARPVSTCGHKADPGYHDPGACPIRSDLYVEKNKMIRSTTYAVQASGKYHSVVYSRKNTFEKFGSLIFRTENNSQLFSKDENCSKIKGDVKCNSSKVDTAFTKFLSE